MICCKLCLGLTPPTHPPAPLFVEGTQTIPTQIPTIQRGDTERRGCGGGGAAVVVDQRVCARQAHTASHSQRMHRVEACGVGWRGGCVGAFLRFFQFNPAVTGKAVQSGHSSAAVTHHKSPFRFRAGTQPVGQPAKAGRRTRGIPCQSLREVPFLRDDEAIQQDGSPQPALRVSR